MSITLTRLDVSAYRVPIDQPVATSFGVMRNRPAVFVRLEDADGAFGFGEIFANWPAAGAEHRARLVAEDFADLLIGQSFDGITTLFDRLTRKSHIRALQSGEWGPFRQVIAGLDTAFVDLLARKADTPVARFLNPSAAGTVSCYASGIAIAQADAQIAQARAAGFSAFKVKVGFDTTRDVELLRAVFDGLSDREALCADANQAWDVPSAKAFLDKTSDLPLGWLEEPLPADAPVADWQRLRSNAQVPLAGGENIAGFDGFDAAIASGVFDVLQPDVAKWGGLSGCFRVARKIRGAGLRYCPHFLGGGIGLVASAHLLAATGGSGLLEVDVNPNPLRDAFGVGDSGVQHLSDAPGLGVADIPPDLHRYRSFAKTIAA